MKLRLILVAFIIYQGLVFGQNRIDLKASFNVNDKTIAIDQEITYKNETNDTLKVIYLNDWNNSYSTKSTPLAKRFAEEYDSKFHFAKSDERGYTNIISITDHLKNELNYTRLKDHPDVIKINLENVLNPDSHQSMQHK